MIWSAAQAERAAALDISPLPLGEGMKGERD